MLRLSQLEPKVAEPHSGRHSNSCITTFHSGQQLTVVWHANASVKRWGTEILTENMAAPNSDLAGDFGFQRIIILPYVFICDAH